MPSRPECVIETGRYPAPWLWLHKVPELRVPTRSPAALRGADRIVSAGNGRRSPRTIGPAACTLRVRSRGTGSLVVAYSDEAAVDESLACERRTAAAVLDAVFHDRSVRGIAFDEPLAADGAAFAAATSRTASLRRVGVSCLLGMLSSDDPLAQAAPHSELAARAAAADRPHEAFHHAACARSRRDDNDDEWFFAELDAALLTGQSSHAWAMARWRITRRGPSPRLDAARATMLRRQHRFDEALELARGAAIEAGGDGAGPESQVELGLSMWAAGDAAGGIRRLSRCVADAPGRISPVLALGSVLASHGIARRDAASLEAACVSLDHVVRKGSYSAPVAARRLARAKLALGRRDDAVELARLAVGLRPTRASSRALERAMAA